MIHKHHLEQLNFLVMCEKDAQDVTGFKSRQFNSKQSESIQIKN